MPVNTRKSSAFLILDKAGFYERAAKTAGGPTSQVSAAANSVVPGQLGDPGGDLSARARSVEWEWAATLLRMHQLPSLTPGLPPPRRPPYSRPRLRLYPDAMSVAGVGQAPTVRARIPVHAVLDRFRAAVGEVPPGAARA